MTKTPSAIIASFTETPKTQKSSEIGQFGQILVRIGQLA